MARHEIVEPDPRVAPRADPHPEGSFPRAAALMIVGFSLVPCMDAIAKYLSADYPVPQIAWARFVFHLAIVAPVALVRHGRRLWPRRPLLQLARGLFQMSATVLFFLALARMPIADALALLFCYPIFVTILSAALLGERVGPRQWLAVAGGLVGVLLILRPGAGAFQWAGGFALAAGACFSLYMVATRKVAGSAPPVVTLFYSALVGAVLLSSAAPWFWVTPEPSAWGLMVLIGLFAAVGHFLIVRAFELAPASRLAPFGYVEIVAATALGFFVFGDLPDLLAVVGIAVIVASGLAVTAGSGAGERQEESAVGFPDTGASSS